MQIVRSLPLVFQGFYRSIIRIRVIAIEGFVLWPAPEWEERKKKGLCFRCGQQFGPTHKCPEGSLRILLLGEDETRADDADFQFLDASLEDKTLIEGQSNVRDPIIMDQIK